MSETPHEHDHGVSLAGEVVVIRHADGMVSVTVDGADFPYFISRDPGMEFLEPNEDRPFPVVLMPVMCVSVEVRDAVPETGPIEGVVVAHPEDDSHGGRGGGWADEDNTPCPCDCCNGTCGSCEGVDYETCVEDAVTAAEDDPTP